MGLRDLIDRLLRSRDQEIVELAEKGVAPDDEVEAVEERVAEHRRHAEKPPEEPPD